MKKFFNLFLVLGLLLSMCAFAPASSVQAAAPAVDCMPPGLPSSFHGVTSGIKVGQMITIYEDNQVVGKAITKPWGKMVVYAVSVRAYDACSPLPGGIDGHWLIFRMDYAHIVGRAQWFGGTDTYLPLAQR